MSEGARGWVTTKTQAEEQAQMIREYWIERGFLGIEVRLEFHPCRADRGPSYNVKTNIGPNGYPPKERVRRIGVIA